MAEVKRSATAQVEVTAVYESEYDEPPNQSEFNATVKRGLTDWLTWLGDSEPKIKVKILKPQPETKNKKRSGK